VEFSVFICQMINIIYQKISTIYRQTNGALSCIEMFGYSFNFLFCFENIQRGFSIYHVGIAETALHFSFLANQRYYYVGAL
jgi:hypothetical protein